MLDKVLVVSLAKLAGSDLPIGRTPLGRPCSRLALLYHWDCPPPPQQPARPTARQDRVRFIYPENNIQEKDPRQ
jgi:hypothetical protein